MAVGQTEELARRGHDVELLAGWDGLQGLVIPQVRVTLRRVHRVGRGFVGLLSPRLWVDVVKAAMHADIFHIHMGRDPLSLISALLISVSGRPFVVQTHGMVLPRRSRVVRLLDLLATRRVLKSARRVLVLTNDEADAIRVVSQNKATVEIIANGIRLQEKPPVSRAERRLLFLARLHPRKRVMAFAEMCRLLRDRGTDFSAHVVGPDEGDLAQLIEYIAAHDLTEHLFYEGPVGPGESAEWLATSGVFILPSVGEVFPMTILEALATGTPVITTTDSGLAEKLSALGAAVITDGAAESLAEAVESIFRDPEYRKSLSASGLQAVETELSISAVASQLERAYRD